MSLFVIRIFFLFISGILGFQVGSILGYLPIIGISFGCGGAAILILCEIGMRRVSMRGLTSMVFGLLLGILMAKLLSDILSLLPLTVRFLSLCRVVLTLVFSYLGAVMALRGKDEFNVIIPYVRFQRQDVKEGVILLDTSVIVDGRISDIYKTHFLSGRLVVPRFVLHELQKIADSEDGLKRQRGRRGMEILRNMQDDPTVDVRIHEDDIVGVPDVDTKLIRLAKILEAKVCTIDFNLGRIASIQDVDILNINELVNAVKSVVFPGEQLRVKLLKEGKESNQAIAYMDDGTMVVVSDSRHLIGQDISVGVTSVLQTSAGRMIFAKLGE